MNSTVVKNSINKHKVFLFEVILILGFSVLSVIPAFWHGYFNSSADGFFHFNRLENIIATFQHGEMPGKFNFYFAPTYFSYPGVAINAMYPWIGGFFFIIPRLLISNPYHGLIVGFILLNMVTIINTRLLMKAFTKNIWLIWLGVIIYQFNNFHLIDLYSRVALGECFGYAWLPLVLLGLIRIHRNEKNGVGFLAISMGMMANSHLLSLLMTAVFIFIYEIVQIIKKQFNVVVLKRLVMAAILALLIGSYSLFNIVSMYATTTFQTPFTGVSGADFGQYINYLITNNMGENTPWTYGLPLIIIQILLTISIFLKKSGATWKNWVIVSDVLFFFTLNVIPLEGLKNTPLGLIQFLGRLNVFIVLFLAMATVQYLKNKSGLILKFSIIIVSILISTFSLYGTYQIHKIVPKFENHRDLITSENYLNIVASRYSFGDYLPLGVEKIDVEIKYTSNIEILSTNKYNNGIEYKVNVNKPGDFALPAVLYNNFQYQIYVDGHKATIFNPNILYTRLETGKHSIKLEVINKI
ncbi:hypothetical protein NFX39_01040 [Fructobacillus sp. W13]|uniref:Membrane protein 6-pyruvoyl-tetrahydropterin synthase-related domain-containing protein n=1 Tax=Fructobacillus apis TaxID=2935017 RepID=A0ABT0ZNV8_9LACO|nr:hypothetical protein [Fructobacillus apis]MCO0831680.1 hypothetical protein [Fructobacillus apis]